MRNKNLRFKISDLRALAIVFILAIIASSCPAMTSKKIAKEPLKTSTQKAIDFNSPSFSPKVLKITDEASKLIYQGRFDRSDQLLIDSPSQDSPYVKALESIDNQYLQMQQRRTEDQHSEFEKATASLKEIENARQKELEKKIPDVNEANDINDITRTLSVIARTAEYATSQEKIELLNNSFVEQTYKRAIDKAAEFESKGKWIDAYLVCYSWLTAIDANNKSYSDYADQLIDKANLVASFMDNPCETSRQRYDGVTKQAFLNAIDILEANYVTRIIDFHQMLSKALTRCKLLAQVLTLSKDQIMENIKSSTNIESKNSFTIPDSNLLTEWSEKIDVIQKDLGKWPLGIDKAKFIDTFNEVLKVNSETAKIPETLLIAQFSEAALSALDPYTVMVWPQETSEFEKLMTNQFSGIGVEISKPRGQLTINTLLPDSPAYNTGLDAGDIIESVDGVPTKDMSLTCAVKQITGPAGTKVKLAIRRAGEDKTMEFTVTRGAIVVPTVYGWQRTLDGKWKYMIDEKEKIGYVRITSFSEKTSDDLEKVLKSLEAEGLQGLIIDLRFNSGGLLNSATEVVDKFISSGLIVSTRPRALFWTYINATKEGTHPDYPLVILINSSSASASEIVAGALADKKYNRAILVGERTHGKGSVQQISSKPGGMAELKFTMAYYHLPSGQRVESQDEMKKQGRTDWGVAPNIEVKIGNGVLPVSDELRKMLEIRRENETLVQAGHKVTGTENKHSLQETLDSDPQLATGLLVVKTKLIDEENSRLLAAVEKSSEKQPK